MSTAQRVAAVVAVVACALCLAPPHRVGAEGGGEVIETSSSSSGSVVIASEALTGYSGGGYSGFDGVLDCTWYDTREPISNPQKEAVIWNSAAVVRYQHIYWFQCVKIASQQVVERGWRAYDPGNGNPWRSPAEVLATWAFHDWDRLPLPDPTLATSPPAAIHVVNLESWFWAQLPPDHQVRTDAGPGNWSLVTATVKNLTLDLDEPGVDPVVCPNGGIPWSKNSTRHDPDACTYTFTKRGVHHITATLTWAITATGEIDGQPINATAPDRTTNTTLDITVNEILTHIESEK